VSVVIDSFPSNDERYFRDHAIVAIDVIRASTTAVTAVLSGRRCFPVASVNEALEKRDQLPGCILAGEVSGLQPEGFDLNNSPADLARRSDYHRPLILVSSSGTKLMTQGAAWGDAYVACLRNYKAVATYIADRYKRVALLGAATRGEFREEDQLCCAWIAAELVCLGHLAEDRRTLTLIDQWRYAGVEVCASGNSAAYLRRSGQLDDLNFILTHVNDVPLACRLVDGEVVSVPVVAVAARETQPETAQAA
jgi:2-phosphosulfolactate phosphatase